VSPTVSSRALEGLYQRLLSEYGPQGWWPLRSRAGRRGFDGRGYHPGRYAGPRSTGERFEIAVGAVLTQNTSWRNVEPGLDALLARRLIDPAAMLECSQRELAAHIRSCGYHNQKARKLHVLAGWFGDAALRRSFARHGREELLSLWGIGPETADSILLYAYGVPVFVVDAYTIRILFRLGWLQGSELYAEVQRLFLERLPAESSLFNEYHALLVRHAKEHCRVRAVCAGCPLARTCPSRGS
jgi:endonuclease-3 related protein